MKKKNKIVELSSDQLTAYCFASCLAYIKNNLEDDGSINFREIHSLMLGFCALMIAVGYTSEFVDNFFDETKEKIKDMILSIKK